MGSAVEEAVAARIAAVRARITRQQQDRAIRVRRRTYGLAQRHAAKLRHLDAKGADDTRTPNPQETDQP